ncbi:MAG TPA: hypothetical protein VE777_08100 [Gaiellales bacterium]|jgi:hypothetical protein|nr:hypothetical protein [Gaiellales bacterium]
MMTTTGTRSWTPRVIPFGVLVIALGAWGGLAPLVGPYFHFSFDTTRTWVLSEQHWTLSIVPGIVAVFGGILLLLPGSRAWPATIAAAAGIWFVVGPSLHPIWSDQVAPQAGGDVKQAALWIADFYGTGALIAYLTGAGQGIRRTLPAMRPPMAAPIRREAREPARDGERPVAVP